ncbi:unnamed protein product [Periconia digitata]|uniref:Uncharacterized protein n=1 Tax=Periconia digitata TaxID=1303443 RepID=A0A9W4UIB4_9PLEO|nr:unnamed protein product [Periconia digitata]
MARFNIRAKPSDDPRWRGGHRHYFTLFTIKNLIIIPFVIFVIVESRLLRSWWGDQPMDYDFKDHWWHRIGIALLPDAALTLGTTFGLCTQNWHPITAVVTTIAILGPWVYCTFVNPFVAYSNERSFRNSDTWSNLCYGEAAFQVVITIIYFVMLGFASKGVHVWRKARGERHTNFEMNARKPSQSTDYSEYTAGSRV